MNNESALKFMFGGNATFTIQNTATGNRFTFKVTQPKPETPHFVKVLTGPDNENHYSFIGSIFNNQSFRYSAKSRIAPSADSVRVFEWVLNKLNGNALPEVVRFFHCGKCGRCGRKLTVPESIDSGFGPECIQHV